MRSVRLFYRKHGNIKFISHLDMNRFMIKMVRLSKIPVWYSEGFNPHPYITFALPLSLGFESEYEVMDVRLDDDSFSNSDAYEMLKKFMPEGIDFFAFGDPIMTAGQVAFARFRIDFSKDILAYADKLQSFFSQDVISAEKKTKKGGIKVINLKDFIKGYSITDSSIEVILSAGSNNLNPKLLLDTFNSDHSEKLPAYSITRTMLYNDKLEKFE